MRSLSSTIFIYNGLSHECSLLYYQVVSQFEAGADYLRFSSNQILGLLVLQPLITMVRVPLAKQARTSRAFDLLPRCDSRSHLDLQIAGSGQDKQRIVGTKFHSTLFEFRAQSMMKLVRLNFVASVLCCFEFCYDNVLGQSLPQLLLPKDNNNTRVIWNSHMYNPPILISFSSW